MKRNYPVFAIVILNLLVFLGWSFATSREEFYFMAENFLVSWNHLASGYWWVLVTSVFSHNLFFHLMINMLALLSFSRIMVMVMGSLNFVLFYLLAGIVGSLMHALTSLYVIQDPAIPALGASGAVSGVILLFSLLFPKEKLLLLGIIPIRAIWGAVFLIVLDLWGMWAQAKGGGLPIGHGAHLGGAFIGVLYFTMFRLKKKASIISQDN